MITVVGFAVALTFVLLLSLYLRQELSVDSFHANKDRIFRLVNEKGYGYAGPIGPRLQQQFPEVECFTRFRVMKDGMATVSPTEKVRFTYALADPAFFRMFSFPLVEGTAEEVLQERYSIVLSRTLAHRLFGEVSPLGKTVCIGGVEEVLVTGVMEDIPDHTHFAPFEAVVNIAGLSKFWQWTEGDILEDIGISSFALYLMEKPGAKLRNRQGDILEYFKKNYPLYQDEDPPQKAEIEPLEKIYFSSYENSGGRQNSRSLMWVLGAIAGIILLLAVVNYINLSIAQGSMRAKEMAVKKLLGSSRRMLCIQFVKESVILCGVAFFIAYLFAVLAEPVFNQLLLTHVSLKNTFIPSVVAGAAILAVSVGIISGWIPGLVITRFQAVDVMKGTFRKTVKGSYSKVLICFQYTVAITLIICTLILVKQTHFMLHYDIGFNRQNIARFSYVLNAGEKEMLRNEIMKLAGVKSVSFVCGDPADGGNDYTFDYEGHRLSFRYFVVDTSFFQMLKLSVMPNVWADRQLQAEQSVWLNREAVRRLGGNDSFEEFKANEGMFRVCGIVNDFHIRDLSQKMEPVMLMPMQPQVKPWNLLVELQDKDQIATFHAIERLYKRLSGGTPFTSGFLEDTIARWYDRTERITGMIGYLCLLAVLLSAMGILAMATYFIQQRIKEIGIRRVNGATILEILQMLMSGFIKWIVIAFVLACPVGYYVMNRWLTDYAYRTSVDWWIFALSGGSALLIAALMICWQSWRAASTNPVEILKME